MQVFKIYSVNRLGMRLLLFAVLLKVTKHCIFMKKTKCRCVGGEWTVSVYKSN